MRNRTYRRDEKELLKLLDMLPETSVVSGTYWMHETAIATALYGSYSSGAIRKARKLLQRLENEGFVEQRIWEMGTSWRLAEKP